jgi:cytidylate kinase
VVEGRDIGSAVFPETPYKFYIDAPPQVRQRRRRNQGQVEEIARRDLIDSTRSTDPLTVAPGATVIDSSTLDIQGVVVAMLDKLAGQGLGCAIAACSSNG